jgi:hypothetical protein
VRENARDTQFAGGEPVGPLTYGKFLECLDESRRKGFRLECASVNKHTLTFLVDSVGFKELMYGSGTCQIHGVQIDIDDRLPDHAIKINGVVYNAAKENDRQNAPRDTQFAGFAELLVRRFDGLSVRYKDWPDWRELDAQMKLAIARGAYDLVKHVYKQVPQLIGALPLTQDLNEIISYVEDLTEWPEEREI